MKRTKKPKIKGKPDAILTGDWHLRDDIPICRNPETFEEEQWSKVRFVKDLQQEFSCPVWHSGDLFNHWKPSPYLLSKTMEFFPDQFYTIYGNHDLPQHNLELAEKCGINVLEKAGKTIVLRGTHWGLLPSPDARIKFVNKSIEKDCLIWHTMTYTGELPWPGCESPTAGKLLRKHPQYDLILTGHNHKPFWTKHEGRLLVNPGSLMRQAADQINYKPAVWLWYADSNTVEPVYLPINKQSVSNAHIEEKKARDERIDAFVEKLNTDFKSKLSFEDSVDKLITKNKIKKSVKNIIYESLE
jgi:DNA repair exonuclease SbcCD nuclease subunit